MIFFIQNFIRKENFVNISSLLFDVNRDSIVDLSPRLGKGQTILICQRTKHEYLTKNHIKEIDEDHQGH